MMQRLDLTDAQLDSALGRTSPLVKLGVALAWLIGLAFTTAIAPPLILAAITLAAGLALGGIRPGALARSLAPLWIAAISIGLVNTLFSAANSDPGGVTVLAIGPIRVTEAALAAGLALGARVVAIASVGAVFALTTDSTRLADSLVQQGRVSDRFAYGALAAYQGIPRFGEDLATLRQARRIRGLRGGWHPRLLLGLLVLAIRHGDRLALAMDARAFGSGTRSRYREVRWSILDGAVAAAAAAAALVAALAAGR
jgi:energy-coupling factor transport system permease protein